MKIECDAKRFRVSRIHLYRKYKQLFYIILNNESLLARKRFAVLQHGMILLICECRQARDRGNPVLTACDQCDGKQQSQVRLHSCAGWSVFVVNVRSIEFHPSPSKLLSMHAYSKLTWFTVTVVGLGSSHL